MGISEAFDFKSGSEDKSDSTIVGRLERKEAVDVGGGVNSRDRREYI